MSAGARRQIGTVAISNGQPCGRGWTTSGDAWLAATAGCRFAAERRSAREERRTTVPVPPPETEQADVQG